MTYKEVKSSPVTLLQLIVSGTGIIVTVVLAFLVWSGNVNDKFVKQNEIIAVSYAKIEVLQSVVNQANQWRAETTNKLDEISRIVTDIRIQIGSAKQDIK